MVLSSNFVVLVIPEWKVSPDYEHRPTSLPPSERNSAHRVVSTSHASDQLANTGTTPVFTSTTQHRRTVHAKTIDGQRKAYFFIHFNCLAIMRVHASLITLFASALALCLALFTSPVTAAPDLTCTSTVYFDIAHGGKDVGRVSSAAQPIDNQTRTQNRIMSYRSPCASTAKWFQRRQRTSVSWQPVSPASVTRDQSSTESLLTS